MGEVLFAAPIFHQVHLSLPWTLFGLAEQLSVSGQEVMKMKVAGTNGCDLSVTIQRSTDDNDDRLIIDVTDPDGLHEPGLVDADESSWKFQLGAIQSPVYLEQVDQAVILSQDLPDNTNKDTESSLKQEDQFELTSQSTDKQAQESVSLGDDDSVTYISPENLAELLASGNVVMKQEEEQPTFNETHILDISELLHGEVSQGSEVVQSAGVIHSSEINCESGIGQGSEEILRSEVMQGPEMLQITQDPEVIMVTQGSDILEYTPGSEVITEVMQGSGVTELVQEVRDGSVGCGSNTEEHLEVEQTEDKELMELASLGSEPVVVVEHPVSSHNIENYIILTPADSEMVGDNVTGLVSDVDTTWDVGGTEISDVDVCDEITPAKMELRRSSKLPKTDGDMAVESSIQVRSVKDIPKIIVDVQAYKCPACSKNFHSIDTLYGHFQRLHRDQVYNEASVEKVTVKDAHLCFLCRHPFNRFDAVRKHLETVHKVQMEKRLIDRQMICPICNSKHSTLHTLRCHLNYKHRDHAEYKEALVTIHSQICLSQTLKRKNPVLMQCPFCLVSLTFKQLMHHLRLAHQDDPNYPEIVSQSKAAIKDYRRRQLHETTKQCKICQKEFPLTSYYSHLRFVHQTGRNDEHKCKVCSKAFHSNWHMEMHMLIHSDERNHKCELCNCAFRNIYSLRKHKKTIHLKQYPFPCDVCGRGFHSRAMLKRHKCAPRPQKRVKLPGPKLSDPDSLASEDAPVLGEDPPTLGGDSPSVDLADVKQEAVTTQVIEVMDVIVGDENEAVTMVIEPVTDDLAAVNCDSSSGNIGEKPVKQLTAAANDMSSDFTDTGVESQNYSESWASLVQSNSVVRIQSSEAKSVEIISPIKTEQIECSTSKNKPDSFTPLAISRSANSSSLASQVLDKQDNYRYFDADTGHHICGICSKSYKNMMSISTHLRRVHHISRKPISTFPCPVCAKTFLLQSKLNTHMQVHEDHSVTCEQCGRVLQGKYLLEKHIRVVHERQYIYNCPLCRRGFEKMRYLTEHRCGRRGISPDSRQPRQQIDSPKQQNDTIDQVIIRKTGGQRDAQSRGVITKVEAKTSVQSHTQIVLESDGETSGQVKTQNQKMAEIVKHSPMNQAIKEQSSNTRIQEAAKIGTKSPSVKDRSQKRVCTGSGKSDVNVYETNIKKYTRHSQHLVANSDHRNKSFGTIKIIQPLSSTTKTATSAKIADTSSHKRMHNDFDDYNESNKKTAKQPKILTVHKTSKVQTERSTKSSSALSNIVVTRQTPKTAIRKEQPLVKTLKDKVTQEKPQRHTNTIKNDSTPVRTSRRASSASLTQRQRAQRTRSQPTWLQEYNL